MYIAIVDDNKSDAIQARELIDKYLASCLASTEQVGFDVFPNAETFLQHFSQGRYVFVVLDIYMDKLTGMQAAQKVMEVDKECRIIFLTTSTEHLLAGYTVHAAGYVLKPLSEHRQELCQAVDYCLQRLQLDKALLFVQTNNVAVSVPLPELYYLECQNSRVVTLHLEGRELRTSTTYQECQEQLQRDKRFLECYHRLLVNMDHIQVMREDTFLMRNGAALPISRRKKNEVKQAYLAYLTEH